jgi:transposase-like protein
MRARGAEAEAKWRGLISEQEQSGRTVAEFCRERGIAASKLYSWKRRCAGEQAPSGFMRLRAAAAVKTKSVATAHSGIEMRLVCGRSLVVVSATERPALRQEKSAPMLLELRKKLLVWKERLLPRHPMAEAIGYALSQWES